MIQIFHGFAALSKNPATQNTHDVFYNVQQQYTPPHRTISKRLRVSIIVIINNLSSINDYSLVVCNPFEKIFCQYLKPPPRYTQTIINDLTVSAVIFFWSLRSEQLSCRRFVHSFSERCSKNTMNLSIKPVDRFLFRQSLSDFWIFVHKNGYTIQTFK